MFEDFHCKSTDSNIWLLFENGASVSRWFRCNIVYGIMAAKYTTSYYNVEKQTRSNSYIDSMRLSKLVDTKRSEQEENIILPSYFYGYNMAQPIIFFYYFNYYNNVKTILFKL